MKLFIYCLKLKHLMLDLLLEAVELTKLEDYSLGTLLRVERVGVLITPFSVGT